jgi:hypothetical protein
MDGRRKKKKKSENLTRVNSNRGPIHYMMNTEVDTSVNFPSLPRRGGWDERDDINNDISNLPILNYVGMLKSKNYHKESPLQN